MAWWSAGTMAPHTKRFGAWVTTWEMDGTQTLMCGMTPVAWAPLPPKPRFARNPLFDDDLEDVG
jgi:hypothetical protein